MAQAGFSILAVVPDVFAVGLADVSGVWGAVCVAGALGAVGAVWFDWSSPHAEKARVPVNRKIKDSFLIIHAPGIILN
jgi:hypothetical protein